MHHSVRAPLALVATALLSLTACSKPPPPPPPAKPPPPAADTAKDAAREKEARDAAVAAYVYGYPLVTMELTRRAATNVAKPALGRQAPMGQLIKQRALPTPSDRDVPAPSVDTLTTSAWLDVGAEPWVISIPDTRGRYALFPLVSAFGEVIDVPGARTTGTKAQKLAVTGPGWKGKLPAGVKEVRSPTALVWMRGRIATTGTKLDLGDAHALQDKLAVVPLPAFGKKYVPPAAKPDPALDVKGPVRDQVHAMDAVAYFKLLATLLKANPPVAADTAAVATFARIGLVPGQDFDGGKLDSVSLKALAAAPKLAQDKILAQTTQGGVAVNGWTVRASGLGFYGVDYLQRAAVAATSLGADRPQDTVIATVEVDADGKPFDGARKYVLHFPKGKLPPAKAFWSLTAYDGQLLLAPNKPNRAARSSRDKLRFNKDGSLDLVVQKDSPGKAKEVNWLPAPAGKFTLVLRLHWPHDKPPSILDGSWKPPAVAVAK